MVHLAPDEPKFQVSFLAPLFLAGAAAVALPFVFHLIRRSSRDKVLFSSLMFLEPSPPRITKRSRLEHLFLLLLRCAVLCLLALAFARPFLQKPLAALASPNQTARVVILVDASASMRRENLWTEARKHAVAAAQKLGPSDSLAVYTFDQQPHSVLTFAEAAPMNAAERAAAIEARLGALSPSWLGTHLGNALLGASEQLLELLNRDAQEQGNTALQLRVISDFQSGARLDGLQGFEWPKKLEVQLDPITGKETSNAGLQILDENQQLFSASTNDNVRVRISNSSASKKEQFALQWRGGGQPVGEPLKLYVPPGQSKIVSAPPRPPEANSLFLTGDSIDFDNSAYVSKVQRPNLSIAYFGTDRADDPGGMRYYVHRAFEQTNLSTRVLVMSNSVPPEAQASALLILGASPNDEALALARNLLQAGRTVLLPLRDSAEANAVSELAGGLLVAAPEAPVQNYALFGQILFQHPLFTPFSDSRFNDFTKIHFWKYRALNLASLTNATTLAAFDSGSPLLVEIPVEKGRLLVLASTWLPADSQLALSSKFVPLLFGILEQSTQMRSVSHQYIVGDVVPLPPDFSGEVRLPDGSTKGAKERFTETGTPGVYAAGDFQFSVNLNPSESKIVPLTPDDLRAIGIPLSARTEPGDLAKEKQRQQHLLARDTEARQKLWRNFLLAGLALILMETWLAGRLSRAVSAA